MNTTATLVATLAHRLVSRGQFLAVAESCTGGLLSAACTDIPGSSQWFDRGFITYSNAAKMEMLCVNPATLEDHGAVSEETVSEMVRGVIMQSQASLAIAISGIAGPGGGSAQKPLGTVCIAWGNLQTQHSQTFHFSGNRQDIRQASVHMALEKALAWLDQTNNHHYQK